MSPKCPQCGYSPPMGRPKKLDDKKIAKLRKQGLGVREIGRKLGVTHGAIRASLARTQQKGSNDG